MSPNVCRSRSCVEAASVSPPSRLADFLSETGKQEDQYRGGINHSNGRRYIQPSPLLRTSYTARHSITSVSLNCKLLIPSGRIVVLYLISGFTPDPILSANFNFWCFTLTGLRPLPCSSSPTGHINVGSTFDKARGTQTRFNAPMRAWLRARVRYVKSVSIGRSRPRVTLIN